MKKKGNFKKTSKMLENGDEFPVIWDEKLFIESSIELDFVNLLPLLNFMTYVFLYPI